MVLKSLEGDHAGFMLLSAAPGAESGDCVFMLAPISTKGIDSNLGVVVSELKVAGEHKFKIDTQVDGVVITVMPAGFPEVVFTLNRQFSGHIATDFGGQNVCIGSAEPAKKSA